MNGDSGRNKVIDWVQPVVRFEPFNDVDGMRGIGCYGRIADVWGEPGERILWSGRGQSDPPAKHDFRHDA